MVKKHPQDLNGSTLMVCTSPYKGLREWGLVMIVVQGGQNAEGTGLETHSPAHMYIIHWPGLLYVYAKYQRGQAKRTQCHDRTGRNEEKAALPRNGVNGKLQVQKNGRG